ncbi:unnamed protein product [Arctogadus glacialis]
MSTLRRVVKPSVLRMNNDSRLRELDLKSSSLYLSHQDSDLGFSFQQQLEASTLAPELKDRISVRCFDFLKEVLVQYQMRLPASMEMLCKLELFCPKLVMSTINRPGVKDLPAEFFSCVVDTLGSQWRSIASAGFSSDQAIDAFWLEVEAFQDAGGIQCFKELALGVIKSEPNKVSNKEQDLFFGGELAEASCLTAACNNFCFLLISRATLCICNCSLSASSAGRNFNF